LIIRDSPDVAPGRLIKKVSGPPREGTRPTFPEYNVHVFARPVPSPGAFLDGLLRRGAGGGGREAEVAAWMEGDANLFQAAATAVVP